MEHDGYSENEAAFNELLKRIEEVSSSQRDKGTRFETLSRVFFEEAKSEYSGRFTKVQTFAEWSRTTPNFPFSKQDIGIDLVATRAEDGLYAAIQCKFYGQDERVDSASIDSFIAASSNPEFFAERIVIATNSADKWTNHARQKMAFAKPAIQLLTREDLGNADIDWASYMQDPTTVKKIAPRKPRPYQQDAIERVINGFETHDRGKLIMACGTGKTFTSMKIAERFVEKGATENAPIMFLVPSLSLLSQTLSDWKQNCKYDIHAFAVCSDTKTGKADLEDIDNLFVQSELRYPATTNAQTLIKDYKELQTKSNGKQLTVVFSTYQSIEVIHEAQKNGEFPEFALTICDEAHRTAGGFMIDTTKPDNNEETAFTRIHDNSYIKSKKRLYMTATPKIYGESAKKSRDDGDAILYSMDDENIFGPVFHEISFRRAVELGSLVDYKVIVLTVSEDVVTKDAVAYDAVQNGGLSVSNAAKVIGCWRALSKRDVTSELSDGDIFPMKRAVGFAQVIKPSDKYDRVSSMQFADHFQETIEKYKDKRRDELRQVQGSIDEVEFAKEHGLVCETKHIDGTMDAFEKSTLLNWLRDDVDNNHCKILFNVRCLSEGVDVPALDSVIFLSPRKSQVDVVQTVGRVMRVSPKTNKKRGYVIIPIVTPPNIEADLVLNNNKDFAIVWQILRALRSIDPDFGTAVDGTLQKIDTDKIEVICLTDKISTKQKRPTRKPRTEKPGIARKPTDKPAQGTLQFGRDELMEDALKARIVKRVGNTREWSDWAKDVGEVCKVQIDHLNKVIDDPTRHKARQAFDDFMGDLKVTINDSISRDDAVEMLGQHIVTAPIMDALFSDYPFIEQNPIGKALTTMISALDRSEMEASQKRLKEFYDSVKYRARNVKTTAERQIVVRELFDKFFKYAFPKQQEKLGIVYTPEEVVDFINHSVADLLKKEFKQSLGDEGVHVLDPFTGTGTFMTRLMQSGLIPTDKLKHKFENELHANEIVPLAYYIASMNMETMYHDITGDPEYKPNNVMVLADTFADTKQETIECKTDLSVNRERMTKQRESDIRIIIGNPPYSVGQESQNDDNQNEHYEELDARLAETYVAKTNSTLKGKLYDSYIRAYRWASDRIGDRGIIGFVTNAGWIESNSADGMRKCLAEEFNSIYVYHLKGNARTQGEQRRKEKDNVFGEGSRAPVAIVLLVKNPKDQTKGKIYFHAVDDYLTREEKLKEVATNKSVVGMSFNTIVPDGHGDWLNQRDDSFHNFMRMDGKKTKEKPIFENFSLGVFTSRDTWCFNSNSKTVKVNMTNSIDFYNNQVKSALELKDTFVPDLNPLNMKWDRPQKKGVLKGKLSPKLEVADIRKASYRPFNKQYLYFNRFWNNCVYQMPQLYPILKADNLYISITLSGTDIGQMPLMSNCIADLHFNGDSQCFPRYLYEEDKSQKTKAQGELSFGDQPTSDGLDGYKRKDGITEVAMKHFREAYPGQEISVDDVFYYIYGILHSEDYRKRYANNLMKELPRIPRVATYEQFKAFSDAGRKLANLHVNYESQPEYQGVLISEKAGASYRVSEMKYGKIPGKKGNSAKDKTTIIYNEEITITNIPLEAQEYVVNKKSALDWVVERACVSVDKASGIVNDFNDYGMELEPPQPRYPLSLVLKVITVSLETMKIVKSLPALTIHPKDMAPE